MIGFVRKTLQDLILSVPIQTNWEGMLPAVPVTGITYNHREVVAGNVFVAHRGLKVDGHDFISQAIERGAVAAVGTQEFQDLPVPYIRVEDAREALAYLSAAFYNFPGHDLTVIGVTGTDGKTTTANLIYNILLTADKRAGIISTVNAVLGDEVVDTGFHVTTPEAPEVQRYLSRMLIAGLTHVVLEATSHGLAQHRVDGCEFDVAVVTNVTHEHLDYHGSYQAYLEAKARLFSLLADTAVKQQGNPRLGVLNFNDPSYDFLHKIITNNQASYSVWGDADVHAANIRYGADTSTFTVIGPGFEQHIQTSLVGPFNVSNCLAAIAATVIGLGIDPAIAAKGIASQRGVPGRMERIRMGQNFMAIVDFAHTPNALRQVLETARQMTSGRVIAIFGSAGLRDREKRRLMAEASAELADVTILTAEDPRTESLDDILAEMTDGAVSRGGVLGQSLLVVPDRGDALRNGIRQAAANDLVIACGKGHEQSMCFGEVEYPWDDRTAMRAGLAELMGMDGPEMPYLPTQD